MRCGICPVTFCQYRRTDGDCYVNWGKDFEPGRVQNTIEALKAELKRMRQANDVPEDKEYAQYELDVKCGYDMAIDDIENFINRLEDKK